MKGKKQCLGKHWKTVNGVRTWYTENATEELPQ